MSEDARKSDAPGEPPALCGVLLIDKQVGFTSMDVCAIVRARLRRAGAPKRVKVGHAGTLDPLATGLLLVLCGKATRQCDALMATEKEYEAGVDLSRASATDDEEGPTTKVDVASPPTLEAIRAALATLTGDVLQAPPAFSAMKVGGKRAYALARDGKPPALAPRPVVIHEINVTSYAWPLLRLHIRCGKGVYIRSIARDLGPLLQTGGMLTDLRRTRVGAWQIQSARTLDQLPDAITQTDLTLL